MLRLLAGLTRSLPLVIALVVLAIVVYFIISWVKSPMKAKEILIKLFLILCSAISIFFVLASIYALVEDNTAVFELAASCAVVGVVGLVITLICRHFFIKHHPHYRFKRTADSRWHILDDIRSSRPFSSEEVNGYRVLILRSKS